MLAVDAQVAQNACMPVPDTNGYFVTGSDTDVGKTYIACQIVQQLAQFEAAVETRKPAESGCLPTASGGLATHDAAALRSANGERESIERIAPFRFRAALAPHRAARLEGRRIHLQELIDACTRDQPAARLIVEGAGGFYSPLAEDGLNADLASALQLPVIIVVSDRIGAVNQALMTIQAVESRHLPVAAVILNQVEQEIDKDMDNLNDLRQHCRHALFRCGRGQVLPPVFAPERD